MRKQARIEIKNIADDGTFEGDLSVYNVVDAGKDLVEPGAYTKTIQERGSEIPLLWQHDPKTPIGKLQLVDTDTSLKVHGSLLMQLPEAQKAYLLIKAQVVKGLSIGYETLKSKMDGSVRRLKELRLYEGSIVTFPMCELALITSVKNGGERKDDFNEEWAEAQLEAAPCQMRCALADALNSFLFDSDLTREERIAGCETSIQQFSDAFMAMLPQLLDLLAEEGPYGMDMGYMSRRSAMAQKQGRMISAANQETIQGALDALKGAQSALEALLAAEAGTTTSDAEAAGKSEPVEDHSALLVAFENATKEIQWNRLNRN